MRERTSNWIIHSSSELLQMGSLAMCHSLIRSLVRSYRSLARFLSSRESEIFLTGFQGVLNHYAIVIRIDDMQFLTITDHWSNTTKLRDGNALFALGSARFRSDCLQCDRIDRTTDWLIVCSLIPKEHGIGYCRVLCLVLCLAICLVLCLRICSVLCSAFGRRRW